VEFIEQKDGLLIDLLIVRYIDVVWFTKSCTLRRYCVYSVEQNIFKGILLS